jgi:Platelet-activating factor acetylhydrolase, isoform II
MNTTNEQTGGSAPPQAKATSTTATLPTPTGQYKVGRVPYDWVDITCDELYSQNKDDKRELVVWVCYPAAPSTDAQPGVYMPVGWEALGQLWGFDTDHVRIHSFSVAPAATGKASYPVLVFSPSGFPPLLLSAILEEVASHGYIVVGINQTYDTTVTVFTDGRVVPINATAIGEMGLFGPTTVPYKEQFRLRAAYVDYKTADIQSVVNQLEQLNSGTGPLAGGLI